MPVQRPVGMMPQQRSFGVRNAHRSERSLDADIPARPLRVPNASRVSPRLDRPIQPVINTAATVEQPNQPVVAVDPPARRRDVNRADRVRDWANRNNEWRDRNVEPTTAPPVNLSGTTGAATPPTTDSHEGHRHDRDGRRNWRERHREWHERHAGDPNFDEKHRRYHRRHYNREWWRRNYNRFVLFGGGYYYWDRGYWYPAYGYDPYYTTYTYDAPLYGYNGLPPGQVISMVQARLQERGYYRSAVDGTFGPMTRQALMNYQADHGLPMTGEIDEETLNSLGFD